MQMTLSSIRHFPARKGKESRGKDIRKLKNRGAKGEGGDAEKYRGGLAVSKRQMYISGNGTRGRRQAP